MKLSLWGGVLTTVLVGALANSDKAGQSKSDVSQNSIVAPVKIVGVLQGTKQQKDSLFGLDVLLNINKTEELFPSPSFLNAEGNFDENVGAGASLIIPSMKFPLNLLFPNYPPFNFTIGFNANKNASLAVNAAKGNVTTTTTPGWGWSPPPETTTTPGWGWHPQPQPTASPPSGWTPSTTTTTTTPGWGWQPPTEPSTTTTTPGWTTTTPGWSVPPPSPSVVGWSRPAPQSSDRYPTMGQHPPQVSNPGKLPSAGFTGLLNPSSPSSNLFSVQH